ncbi:MAG: MBL fold metallo-hydrolase [Defluviitaleaceae bacterium]|nr:MBL fold metallo-hydrolase [Defluviitaleaceae bacterium]MCL2275327.1 MBL fold metallo-hydrolase [Defluviitaleaceae bacterium]
MNTKFQFHSGLNTIGGNIAEVRYGDARVLFDFGRAYNPADTLLSNAQGREGRKVADMLRLGMIPKIDGIYSKDDLAQVPDCTLVSAEEWAQKHGENTVVFISHLHLDHMGAIDVLAPNIPVYMSTEGAALYEALVKLGEPPFCKNIKAFDYEKPLNIGEITVTGYAIDHDVHGASTILVETPDTKIAHSGDIRMRGQRQCLNRNWISAMREKQVDYLFMEGTAFWPPRDDDAVDNKLVQHLEGDVPDVIGKILNEAEGVVFFNFYHRNLERMENLRKAADIARRRIVLEGTTATLAHRFFPNEKYDVLHETVTLAQVNQNPKGYFVQNSLPNIFSLLDYIPQGSAYIHTNGIPLGPFDPAFNSMLAFLKTLGIAFHTVPSAGHGNQEEILEIIDGIQPKTLVPWHSPAPGEMKPLNLEQKILLPELGRWY